MIAIKSPWILAALLFCAFAADSSKAFAQDKPINFPAGQEVPLPGPSTSDKTVTLWQLPDEYKAILETESGELYGIYYSAWSNPNKDNPGVSATGWVTGAQEVNVPWAGEDNADLAKELSIKYFEQKDFLMKSSCDAYENGSNTSCRDGVQNLDLYGYWNGGGFASWTGNKAEARPNKNEQNNYQINYYWNGDLFTTPKTANDLRIQAFAGCKLSEQGTISSGKTILTSALAPEQDCERGVASVFEGGTLEAVEGALDLDENFAVRYGDSEKQSDIGGTIENKGLDLTFTGRFDSVGDGANGTLIFTGSGSSTIRNQAELRGNLIVDEGSLTITSPSSLPDRSVKQNPSIGNLRLIPTPLIFEDGNNTILVKTGTFLRVAGDDLQDGVGPRTPGNSDQPINGDGNRRSPVISLGDGVDNLNLRYGSRTTNYLQTELGMKLSLPINSGERGLWVPNLRVAWLGDWDQNNQDQSIGYSFTDQTVGVASQEEHNNGVLIEAGLDYTMANINSGSWKLYMRGGAEVWGGVRGTDWRASGGMTWQF